MKLPQASLTAVALLSLTASVAAQAAPTTQASKTAPARPALTLSSPSFSDGGIIPDRYTAAATPQAPVSPALAWSSVPEGTLSFVVMMHDPDTALKHRTDEVLHWIVVNIPGTSRSLPEGLPLQAEMPDGTTQLPNTMKRPGYGPPGAAANGPYHHYTLELFALDQKLDLRADASEADVDAAMQGHILGKAVYAGRFHRQ